MSSLLSFAVPSSSVPSSFPTGPLSVASYPLPPAPSSAFSVICSGSSTSVVSWSLPSVVSFSAPSMASVLAPAHSLVPPVVSQGPSVSSSSSFFSPVASFPSLPSAPSSFAPSVVPEDLRSFPGVSAGPGFSLAFVGVKFGCLTCRR